jgi:hypothetical protein
MPNLEREAGVRFEDLGGQCIIPRERDRFDKDETAKARPAIASSRNDRVT